VRGRPGPVDPGWRPHGRGRVRRRGGARPGRARRGAGHGAGRPGRGPRVIDDARSPRGLRGRPRGRRGARAEGAPGRPRRLAGRRDAGMTGSDDPPMTDRFIPPMLATLVREPFDDPAWLYEVKWDGFRVEAVVGDGDVRLWTRGRQDAAGYFGP